MKGFPSTIDIAIWGLKPALAYPQTVYIAKGHKVYGDYTTFLRQWYPFVLLTISLTNV